MLLAIIVLLFYVQPLSENSQNILNTETIQSCIVTDSDKFRLVQEHNMSTISHSVLHNNYTLQYPNLISLLSSETVLEEKTVKSNPSNSSTSDSKEFNSTIVAADNGLNRTPNDDKSVFNVTFDEKMREDGYRLTKPEQHPYSVLIVTKGRKESKGLCTGSLLTPEWVLTAAHCFVLGGNENVKTIEIYAGVSSLEETKSTLPQTAQMLQSKVYVLHSGYKTGERNDVALVRTSQQFNMTDTVKTVSLSLRPWTHVSYRTCMITGFGKVDYHKESTDDYKRKTHTLSVKNPCKCNFRLKRMYGKVYPTKSYICAKPEKDYGICSGDSGGGLICEGELHATAMMIVKMYDTKDCELDILSKVECASEHGLTVFLDMCPYLRWINSRVGLLDEDLISPDCREVSGSPRSNRASLVCVSVAALISFILNLYS